MFSFKWILLCVLLNSWMHLYQSYKVSHPKGNSYSYFDDSGLLSSSYGKRIAGESSGQTSNNANRASTKNGGSPSYDGYSSQYSPSTYSNHKAPKQSYDSKEIFAKEINQIVHGQPDQSSNFDSIIPEMVFSNKSPPNSITVQGHEELTRSKNRDDYMFHDNDNYKAGTSSEYEPSYNSNGAEYETSIESPQAYQQKGTPYQQHNPKSNSGSAFGSYLSATPSSPIEFGGYEQMTFETTTPMPSTMHSPKEHAHQYSSSRGAKKYSRNSPPSQTYMTLTYEPANEKPTSTISFSDEDHPSNRHSSKHSHQNRLPLYSESQYGQTVEDQQESPNIFKSYSRPSSDNNPSSHHHHNSYSTPKPTQTPQVAQVLSYFSSYTPTQETRPNGQNNSPNKISLYSDSGSSESSPQTSSHGYRQSYSMDTGKRPSFQQNQAQEGMASEVEPVSKYNWKQSVQKYAQEFGFEMPPHSKQESTGEHQDKTSLAAPHSLYQGSPAKDDKNSKFYFNVAQFDSGADIFGSSPQNGGQLTPYTPSVAGSKLTPKFDTSESVSASDAKVTHQDPSFEQKETEEVTSQEIEDILQKYNDVIKVKDDKLNGESENQKKTDKTESKQA